LSERLSAGEVVVVDDLRLDEPKTKGFVDVMKNLELSNKSALFVAPTFEKNVRLASRNVERVELTTSDELNTYQLLKHDRVIFTRGGFEKFEERLAD